ncbi:MAG: hypothetical protein B7Y43_10625 [Sphingomonas sp. 28-62-20]|uniref:nuclear transport factor 2 family protein n=1 Tax=Sphingomonas sp. 28-62-20 TaxID=1970433 RepID=UPI000BCC7584|nr:MAG: hypothetical protein B7Y43_10625 [Sphingomonas sp. 28-62-20]
MPLTLLPLLLQVTPTPPLPKGNPSPPPTAVSEFSGVMAPVNAVFAAIAAGDGEMLRPMLRADGNLFVASEGEDGSRKITHLTMADFMARLKPGGPKLEERLYDPAIEIDGDIALVWGRFNFYIDGKLHHCGYDHFDLVREGGNWKIANITYSSRMTGCEAQ